MADINHLFSAKQLKALGPKQRAALKKHAVHHVRTSPEIHKIISSHPEVRKIMTTKPHAKFRTAMRAKLHTTYNRLKTKRPNK
jgi:hypothetical protein